MKGYPKSRFEIVNQPQTKTIDATPSGNVVALYMQPYTSNKGSEDWELLTSFKGFTDAKGGISFNRHGQAQLTVAQALRSGAYVLGKRLVSDDATLANTTVMARVIVTSKMEISNGEMTNLGDTSHIYLYTKSGVGCTTFDDACKAGYGEFDPEAENVTDIPLFTVTPMGRGESLLFFTINPEYGSSRLKNVTNYAKYSFEVMEDNKTLESISITLNPEIVVDGVAQSINPKIKTNSNQVRVKMYEDGIYKLVELLAKTAVDDKGDPIPAAELLNMDFINGYNRNGTAPINGIRTIVNDAAENSIWNSNIPEDIKVVYDLSKGTEAGVGIPLANGSFGTMSGSPMATKEGKAEVEKLLLDVFGANTVVTNDGDIEYPGIFDTIIYDLDAYKIDCIFDCGWSTKVKQAIINLVNARGDASFIVDLGTTANTLSSIKTAVAQLNTDDTGEKYYSNYASLYHNYFKIIDDFTKKEITVTMPYLLIDKMTDHIAKGVNRPFAGIANNLTFDNIVEGSVNFFPVEIPGIDQKQELADINVNYLSMYDGVPVMETMYVNQNEHTQLSYLHNIMAVQEIIKAIRTRCPQSRYTFLSGDDLETYISDVQAVVKEYTSNFKNISCEYMADEKYEQNNIFYAVLKVQFKNFIQEEYFKIIAIS